MLSDAEKLESESLLAEAFSSYNENIVIYKKPVADLSSVSGGFSFGFGEEQYGTSVSYLVQSGQFPATVEYADNSTDQEVLFAKTDIPFSQPKGILRISVSGTGAKEFLDECEKIVIDGKDFRISSDIFARGLFERRFYDCWLEKIDNG